MSTELRDALVRQLDLAWKLATHHLDGLTTEECLWRPARAGLHVHRDADRWIADWPEHEGYDLGPSSIAWITWHMIFWWSMVLDHSFGARTLSREGVYWPGSAEAVRRRLRELHDAWRAKVLTLDGAALASATNTRWPMQDRPFCDVVAWVNIELAKNAAELGYARFLYAAREPGR